MRRNPLLLTLLAAIAGAILLAVGDFDPALAQTAPQIPAIASGQARIWFYRDWDPIHTQARPYLRLNGAIVAISEPGGSFYRDVAPGHYHITVDSYGVDYYQDRDVDLLSGQEVYAKIVSNDNWVDYGGGRRGFHRDTFYVWTMPWQTAFVEMPRTRYFGGGQAFAAAAAVTVR